ncbi:hypothetical protein KAS24_01095 [Candidatus Bathyarchaeota archaeon]|nr:hypothetical protein [Candidatus Bathyarchaeota archaeon]
MKEWKITLLGAVIMFMAGIGMFLWGNSLGLSAILLEAYPGYFLIAEQFLMTFLAGILFVGLGGGLLICTLLIYQLEKKLYPN